MTSQQARTKYGIPNNYREIDGVRRALLGYSELCVHTKTAGKFIRRLWANSDNTYGYAELIDGGIVSGCLFIHSPYSISLS